LVNAAILVSAWSAAASDLYISSRYAQDPNTLSRATNILLGGFRYLFFLAKNDHAPKFLAQLIRFPRATVHREEEMCDDVDISDPPLVPPTPPDHAVTINSSPSSSVDRYAYSGGVSPHPHGDDSVVQEGRISEDLERQTIPQEIPDTPPKYVLPLASVFVSSSVGLLAFMTVQDGGPRQVLASPTHSRTLF
jgi:amino acid transporter